MDLEAKWIVGYVENSADFFVDLRENEKVFVEFSITQSMRDVQVLYALKTYFGCGTVRKNGPDKVVYKVRNLEHLTKIIIPFFEKHQLKTKKGIEFQKFRKILLKMKNDASQPPEIYEEIRTLKEQLSVFKLR